MTESLDGKLGLHSASFLRGNEWRPHSLSLTQEAIRLISTTSSKKLWRLMFWDYWILFSLPGPNLRSLFDNGRFSLEVEVCLSKREKEECLSVVFSKTSCQAANMTLGWYFRIFFCFLIYVRLILCSQGWHFQITKKYFEPDRGVGIFT